MLDRRLVALFTAGLLVGAASAAQAGVQMYRASWVTDSFGNDRVLATASLTHQANTNTMCTGTHCGTGASEYFGVFAVPQGVLCNPGIPRCSFNASPTSGSEFQPNPKKGAVCRPLSQTISNTVNPGPWTTSVRPAKGGTAITTVTTKGPTPMTFQIGKPSAPRYRNPFFFTPAGAPKVTACNSESTAAGINKATMYLSVNDPLRGKVMKGKPLTGKGLVNTFTAAAGGAFTFMAAPATPGTGAPTGTANPGQLAGFRRTTIGEFTNLPPYLYSYTYATLRNSSGFFSQGGGFFSTAAAPNTITLTYSDGMGPVAKAVVQDGVNRFGGVMRLLGQLTTKVCYYRVGGCSLGGADWLYDYIGVSAPTAGGVVTNFYSKKFYVTYFHTGLYQASPLQVRARRFPWTTGTVTLTAFRGPHKTIHRREGTDTRSAMAFTSDGLGGGPTTLATGKIQLVSPILTTWFQSCCKFETGGIAILQLEFLPEPRYWMMLVGGLSLLGVLYRFRGR